MATPRKEKVEETPGYCKTEVLANLFDTSSQWIGQLTRDGVLVKHKTPAGQRYNIVESTRSYVRHLREKASGREEKKATEEKELERWDAEIGIKKAKAVIANLEAKELQGKMHRSEDVAAMTEDLIYTIRSMLVALPGRLAVDAASADTPAEAAEIIRKEVFKAMGELANYKYNPAKYEERVRERRDWDTEIGRDADDE